MITWFASRFVGWKGYVIVAVLSSATTGASVWKLRDWMAAEEKLKEARKVQKGTEKVLTRTAASADVTQKIGTEVATRQSEIRYVYRTIKEEVPVYVTPETDTRYLLPNGFVRLHDAAAAGRPPSAVPDSAGQPDGAPSGVALSAAAGVIVDNYELYHQCKAVVEGWQGWYDEQKALWNKD